MDDSNAYDNKELLKNVSPEMRQKRIQGRIEQLEKDIFKQQSEASEIKEVLKERFNFEIGIQSKL